MMAAAAAAECGGHVLLLDGLLEEDGGELVDVAGEGLPFLAIRDAGRPLAVPPTPPVGVIAGGPAPGAVGCEELLAPEDGARGVADDRPVRHIAVDAEGGDGPVLGIADDDRRRQEAAAGRGGRAITDASPEVAAGGRLEETVRGRVAGTAPGDVALDGDDRVGEGREIVEDDLRGSGQRSLKGADELLERGEDIPPAGSIRPPDGFGTTVCGIALHWAFHAPYLASWLPWEAFTVLLLGSTI